MAGKAVLTITMATLVIAVSSYTIDHSNFLIENESHTNKRSINPPSNNINSRIIHGNEAQQNSHPYMAGLLVTMQSSPGLSWTTVSGGSIISEKIVLTTAFSIRESLQTLVILGAHRLFTIESSQQRFYVQRDSYIVHPEYESSIFQNDIALLKLSRSVIFNKYVQPIKLPSDRLLNKDFVGDTVQITGWGRFSDHSGSASEFLRVTQNKIISNEECSGYFGVFVSNDTMCTETYQSISGTCRGDNGSPLTFKENEESELVLIGAVSFGVWIFNFGCDPTGNGFLPNGNTRISDFVPWILQYIEK